MRAIIAMAGFLAIALAGCSGGPRGPRPIDARVTVNGHALHLTCSGGPGPTVVFEPGIGGDHSLWPIADRIRDRAVACLYDRPGDGEAPRPDRPRTARTDVADLHDLLAASGAVRPVVMVGHSYGGLVAWMAAAEHPADVAGVVLIDPSTPHDFQRMTAVMSAEQTATFMTGFTGLVVDFGASQQEGAAELADFPDIPLTVITATKSMDPWCSKGLPCASMQAVALDLSDDYAGRRPDVRHVFATTSHYVQSDDPDLVVAEILRIVDAVAGRPSPSI